MNIIDHPTEDMLEEAEIYKELNKTSWAIDRVWGGVCGEHITTSKGREETRHQIVKLMIFVLPYVKKKDRVSLINDLGYFHEAECARIMGVSRQLLNNNKRILTDYIEYEGRKFFRPVRSRKQVIIKVSK